MFPDTKNKLPTMGCLSAMRRCIRRGLELDAMRFAVEPHQTSKAYASMVCNRVEIISHEDFDTQARPDIVPFVRVARDQARAWYDPAKHSRSRMPIGNAIRLMSRAPKSREGDHFHTADGLAEQIKAYTPAIPDWAKNRHTIAGKKLGRGLEYFRTVSTVLVPPTAARDSYESEAYRLLALKERAVSADPLRLLENDDDLAPHPRV